MRWCLTHHKENLTPLARRNGKVQKCANYFCSVCHEKIRQLLHRYSWNLLIWIFTSDRPTLQFCLKSNKVYGHFHMKNYMHFWLHLEHKYVSERKVFPINAVGKNETRIFYRINVFCKFHTFSDYKRDVVKSQIRLRHAYIRKILTSAKS
jgi:hypothetical protein